MQSGIIRIFIFSGSKAMVLVNAVNGRLRVRSPILKIRKIGESIESQVLQMTGVTEARLNPTASSMVVRYDPAQVEMDALEERLEQLCTQTQIRVQKRKRDLSRTLNLASKVGMAGTLAGTIGLAYFGSKKNHERMGWAFLSFAAYHLLKNRTTLLR
jgi:cation transport ATPase